MVSMISFLAIIIVIIQYRDSDVETIRLPLQLNLNGLMTILSTVCKIALMIPIASVISQKVWTWFFASHKESIKNRQLRDLELSDEASRSAWDSFKFLLQFKRK